jgi:hypothetical protein
VHLFLGNDARGVHRWVVGGWHDDRVCEPVYEVVKSLE